MELRTAADFYFGSGNDTYNDKDFTEDILAEVACCFHEEQIVPWDNDLWKAAGSLAQILAERAGLKGVTVQKVQKAEGLAVEILSEGIHVVTYDIDVYIDDDDLEKPLSGGGTYRDMWDYNWEQIDRLAA